MELLPTRLRVSGFLLTNGTWWALARLLAIFFAFAFKDWSKLVFFLAFCLCMVLLLSQLKRGGGVTERTLIPRVG